MKRFNIMAGKKYIDKQGQEKTKWVKLGTINHMQDQQTGEDKYFGDLDAVPAGAWFDGSIQLFEQEQRQNGQSQQYQQQGRPQQQYQQQGQPQQQYQQQGQPQYQQQGHPR